MDVQKCPDMPPESDSDYAFDKTDLIPPVGENLLMHLLRHPEDFEDETVTYQRLPKRRLEILRVPVHQDVTRGWGIYLVEGFLAYKIWCIFTSLFLVGSLVFALVWSLRMSDIQGAFSVAAYLCGLCTLFIGCLIICLE